jgi:hypothetical protein
MGGGGGGRRLDGDACPPPPQQRLPRLTAGSGEASVSASASCSGVGSRPLFSIKARSFVLSVMNSVASLRTNAIVVQFHFPCTRIPTPGIIQMRCRAFRNWQRESSARDKLSARVLNFRGAQPRTRCHFPLVSSAVLSLPRWEIRALRLR